MFPQRMQLRKKKIQVFSVEIKITSKREICSIPTYSVFQYNIFPASVISKFIVSHFHKRMKREKDLVVDKIRTLNVVT